MSREGLHGVALREAQGYKYDTFPLGNSGTGLIDWSELAITSQRARELDALGYVLRRVEFPGFNNIDVFVHPHSPRAVPPSAMPEGFGVANAEMDKFYGRRYALSPDLNSLRVDIFGATRKGVLYGVAQNFANEFREGYVGMVAEMRGAKDTFALKDCFPVVLYPNSRVYWDVDGRSTPLGETFPLMLEPRIPNPAVPTAPLPDRFPIVAGSALRAVYGDLFEPLYGGGPEIGMSVSLDTSDAEVLQRELGPGHGGNYLYGMAWEVWQHVGLKREHIQGIRVMQKVHQMARVDGARHLVVKLTKDEAGIEWKEYASVDEDGRAEEFKGPVREDPKGLPAMVISLPLGQVRPGAWPTDHYRVEDLLVASGNATFSKFDPGLRLGGMAAGLGGMAALASLAPMLTSVVGA